jgi:hypothetical protein
LDIPEKFERALPRSDGDAAIGDRSISNLHGVANATTTFASPSAIANATARYAHCDAHDAWTPSRRS